MEVGNGFRKIEYFAHLLNPVVGIGSRMLPSQLGV